MSSFLKLQAADVRYTIWHLDTGNLIVEFATESAAVAAVRGEIQANASPDALRWGPGSICRGSV